MSLVSWPCRNSAASAPLTTSLPRSRAVERSRPPRAGAVLAVELDRGARRAIAPILGRPAALPRFRCVKISIVDEPKRRSNDGQRWRLSRRRLLVGGAAAGAGAAGPARADPPPGAPPRARGRRGAAGHGARRRRGRTARPRRTAAASHAGFAAGADVDHARQRLRPDRDPARLRLRQDAAAGQRPGAARVGARRGRQGDRGRARGQVSRPGPTTAASPGRPCAAARASGCGSSFANGSAHPHTIHFHGIHPALHGRHAGDRRGRAAAA